MDGRTLLVGTSVAAKTFGPQMSKVFRLNPELNGRFDAADHHWGSGRRAPPRSRRPRPTEAPPGRWWASAASPIPGCWWEIPLINIAESYLRQLDLRNRQVAVNVQILSVSLTNDKTIDASFSARMGDKYVVSRYAAIQTGQSFRYRSDWREGPWSQGLTPPGRPASGRATGLCPSLRCSVAE